MVNRYDIIDILKKKLYPQSYVHAFWLEGADANNAVDEYSDLDFCLDIDDDYEKQAMELVEQILNELSAIDYKFVMKHGHPKLRQNIYHLEGTSPYLMIDFCWQLHSRDPKESCFIRDSKIEYPLVIFDKSNVISYRDFDINEFLEENRARFNECRYRYTQHDRVLKYVRRGLYLESYAYYNRYVLAPIIDLLRIIYTPANTYYHLIHISHHIPDDCVRKLEAFAQVASLTDIENKTDEARVWFEELCKEAAEKYRYEI